MPGFVRNASKLTGARIPPRPDWRRGRPCFHLKRADGIPFAFEEGQIEEATEVFAAIGFLVIGLSHLIQPKGWVAFYQALAARGTAGVFLEGLLVLTFGAFIVAFHNVWHGPATVLTVVGWAQVLKGVGRLLAPQIATKAFARIDADRAWYFRAGGVMALVLSGFLWWIRFSP